MVGRSKPAFISAFGSYGSPGYRPSFAGRTLALIDQGAVVGYAAVRGGGEYGREWHRAGKRENKPNTWRDLIAVCEDTLRYVAEPKGYVEEPEWGAISDPAGYSAVKSIDSLHAVVDGTPYPAVLLSTGVTDPRVAPFYPAKMAARLQAATSSGRPILLRVDFDAGHGMGSTRAQQDAEAADTYAFILWQTAGGASIKER